MEICCTFKKKKLLFRTKNRCLLSVFINHVRLCIILSANLLQSGILSAATCPSHGNQEGRRNRSTVHATDINCRNICVPNRSWSRYCEFPSVRRNYLKMQMTSISGRSSYYECIVIVVIISSRDQTTFTRFLFSLWARMALAMSTS